MENGNATKMSLEQRFVQNLKEERLFALLGDEDALTELVKRAIHEALYQPERIHAGYGRIEEKDSIVVKTAKEIAARVADKLIADMATELLADQTVRLAVLEAMARGIPEAIRNGLYGAVQSFGTQTADATLMRVQDAIRNKML